MQWSKVQDIQTRGDPLFQGTHWAGRPVSFKGDHEENEDSPIPVDFSQGSGVALVHTLWVGSRPGVGTA